MTGFAAAHLWLNSAAWLWSHVSFGWLAAAVAVSILDRYRRVTQSLSGSPATPTVSPEKPVARERRTPLRAARGGAFFLAAVAAGLIPVGFTDLAGYLVAVSGELSFATLFYLGLVTFRGRLGSKACELRSGIAPRIAWVACGVAVYGSALSGRGPDVYAWGFAAAAEGVALALSAAVFATGRRLTAAMLLGVVLARQIELCGSGNLWDYAIDPFLFVGSAGYLLWVAGARGSLRLRLMVQRIGDARLLKPSGTARSPQRTIASADRSSDEASREAA